MATSRSDSPDDGPQLFGQLAPLESLMLHDSRRGYSMSFFVETLVEGPLCRDRFTRSVQGLVARHQRLGARIRNRLGLVAWMEPDRIPRVEWFPWNDRENIAAALTDTPADLRTTSGVRFMVVEAAPGLWQIMMHVHHAVCDGVAALEVLGDLWSLYHGVPLPDFRPGKRTHAPPSPAAPSEPAAPWWRVTYDFLRNRPAVVARTAPPATTIDAATWPPYTTATLSSDFTNRLRRAAEAASATLNDVVVAATMRAIVSWNTAAGAPDRIIRINMPTNLRASGSRGPAANEMGYAFLDRTPAECSSYRALVTSLAAASRWIQATRATQQFLDVLAVCCRIPGLLQIVTRLPLSFSTAVVSNVGNVVSRMKTAAPIQDGRICPADLVITRITGVPPLRPGTRVAVGVTTYQGAMTISIMCAPELFSAAAQQRLADQIRDEIIVFPEQSQSH
jgi:hypothetical protein